MGRDTAVHSKYLGDSFDIVKRFWADCLGSVAPLFAHTKFVPQNIQEKYERMVGVRLLPADGLPVCFGLFLDPNTGIPLPTSSSQGATASHATVSFIVREFNRLKPTYMVCFEQSHDRSCGLTRREQRDSKRRALQSNRIVSFYYVSHAPFLFMARDDATLQRLLDCITNAGMPSSRFERMLAEGSTLRPKQGALCGQVGPAESAASPATSLCPACGQKEFKRWPLGWDAHAAHSCQGLEADQPEARKAEFRRRFGDRFGGAV
jgi:hypothetical protein